MKRMEGAVASLLGLAAGLALWAASTTVAITRPAIWVEKGTQGAVCLYGTVHWLPKRMDWRSTQVSFALDFAESPSLWVRLPNGREAVFRAF